MSEVYELSHLLDLRNAKPYYEFLRIPEMSAGIYVLRQGAVDLQQPHKEAEIYYVVSGRARMFLGSEDRVVMSGSAIFVEAGQEHRFHDIEEELVLLVVFAPAES